MALAEFTFSNGTRIPKGAFVSAIGTPRQLDDEVYTDAKTFNGFRFSDMGEREGMKNQLVTTSNDFLLFGHGKHAWCVLNVSFHFILFWCAELNLAKARVVFSLPSS